MAMDRWRPFGPMERWSPFREMMETMDRFFEEGFGRPFGPFGGSLMGSFPIDMAESDQEITVRAAVPGLRPEDLQITVHGDTLTIRGETKAEEERNDRNWIIRERRAGTMQRMITLPGPVDVDRAEAKIEDGVLTLTLPKSAEARPRQIRVGGQALSDTQRAMPAGQGQQTVRPAAGAQDTVRPESESSVAPQAQETVRPQSAGTVVNPGTSSSV